ncbi:OstA family protein [Sphingorhabdus lutea]|uniref:OstA family protein n=1 Tax=Sphingorhabdus lutea TaxID=1913578 RepID=A0A1L3JA02_9SPHN|nr:LptA/OstA family protein [Sphingorhabdus lutea]APG61965.1 OstA family protein [Sphingorhabdus lutea]
MRYKSFIFGILGFAGAASFITVSAPAQIIQNHNSNAPVNFSAERIELQDRSDRVVLSGGVTVTQAGLTLRANNITAAYSNSGNIDVNRMDALGGVTIVKDDLRASSNSAIYDLDSDLITLIGNVSLTQGANKLNGGRIVIDLKAGRSTISGGNSQSPSVPGIQSQSGRVTGTFNVPQRDDKK